MKPRNSCLSRTRFISFPRPQRRGLIEAHSHTPPPRGGKNFPRPQRRGLIEAALSLAWARASGPFRDLSVAASLKLARVGDSDNHIGNFPRPQRRGLIEARRRGGPTRRFRPFPRPQRRGLIEARRSPPATRPPSPFRDLSVAASLKPPWEPSPSQAEPCPFRDLSVAASLKRDGRWPL